KPYSIFSRTFTALNAQPMDPLFLISMPGGSEWLLIFLAILLLFGGKKIPELMRGIGKGIREFNSAKANVQQELEDGMKEADKKDLPK
ncbi:MAG: twin-arginine translocase TatA/TatE family subunit, partial [Chitinophagales bacterium]